MTTQLRKSPPPFAGNSIVRFLDKQLEALKDTVAQRDVARACGYQNANIISMFKTGQTRVPLEKIPALARVLGVDPAFLMRLGLEQYWRDDVDVLAQMFRNTMSENEKALVTVYRNAVGNLNCSLPEFALTKIYEIIEITASAARKYEKLKERYRY